MAETKKVQIVLRDGWEIVTPFIHVLWECPTCGEPMGEPRGHNFYEDGNAYHCDMWDNPCGHVAKYNELKMTSPVGFITWKEILQSNQLQESFWRGLSENS